MILSDRDSFSLSLSGFEEGFVSKMHIFFMYVLSSKGSELDQSRFASKMMWKNLVMKTLGQH